MMKKLYCAHVVNDMIGYFEARLNERKDKIKVVHANPVISENGESLVCYILEAEEGVINSEWTLK